MRDLKQRGTWLGRGKIDETCCSDLWKWRLFVLIKEIKVEGMNLQDEIGEAESTINVP